jgi:hypothetical protein
MKYKWEFFEYEQGLLANQQSDICMYRHVYMYIRVMQETAVSSLEFPYLVLNPQSDESLR